MWLITIKKREKGIKRKTALRDKYISELSNDGCVSELTKYLCDLTADEYYEMALWVRGVYEFDKKRVLTRNENGELVKLFFEKYDAKCASIAVKDLLEEGFDTKVLFFPVYKNDDVEEYARLVYRKGFRNGVTVMPYFCDQDNRPEDEKRVDYVFLDVEADRYQFTSLGEVAVLQSYDMTEDIIAMLCRANTDFSHVEHKGDKPVHSFTYLMRDDTFAEEMYKEKMINIFEKVYMNDENGLNENQRDKIMLAMIDCVDKKSETSQEICEDRKIKITKSLRKMIKKFKEKTVNKESNSSNIVMKL